MLLTAVEGWVPHAPGSPLSTLVDTSLLQRMIKLTPCGEKGVKFSFVTLKYNQPAAARRCQVLLDTLLFVKSFNRLVRYCLTKESLLSFMIIK